jgi:hypothetical protein
MANVYGLPSGDAFRSYPWSSYRVHGMGRSDPLLQRLPVWETLAKHDAARAAYWRQ